MTSSIEFDGMGSPSGISLRGDGSKLCPIFFANLLGGVNTYKGNVKWFSVIMGVNPFLFLAFALSLLYNGQQFLISLTSFWFNARPFQT